MKARVKRTNKIVDIYEQTLLTTFNGNDVRLDEVEFLEGDTNFTTDYWTRLEHQYAGMAMQGMSEKYLKDYRDYCAGFGDMDKDEAKATMKDFADAMADVCYYFAHALVEKLKSSDL